MRLLIALCLFGVVLSVPKPGFRYAYMIPQGSERQPWSQFNERSDNNNYAWGYEFPGRAHFESKDDEGTVKGSFGYVDPNGTPIIWQYSSHPNIGFQVNTGTGQALPQAAESVDSEPAPSKYSTRNDEPSPFYFPTRHLVETVISPLLKQAVASNVVVPAGSSPTGIPQYAVDPEVVRDAGGVSATAHLFGAIPVAAVHDVQSRPSFTARDSAFLPVLNHYDQPDVTLYAIEVPIQ